MHDAWEVSAVVNKQKPVFANPHVVLPDLLGKMCNFSIHDLAHTFFSPYMRTPDIGKICKNY